MSLFRRPREEQRAIRDLPWGEGVRSHGESISPERALRLAPVFGAANLLAGKISSLPIQVYSKVGDSRVKAQLPQLFQRKLPMSSRHNWMYRAVTSLALRGNAVGLITARDGMGYATALEWLPHDWVNVEDSNLAGPGSFHNPIWRVLGRPVPTEDIVHIPWFVVPGRVWGLSPIQAFASSANIALSALDYKNDWFRAGGVPPGTFQNQAQIVEQDVAKVMKARLVESIRTHEPLVYGKDWEYTPISIPVQDAEFVETMQLSATQIAVIYGIPPAKIGGKNADSLTYSTVELNAIELIDDVLMPWFTRFEAAFDQQLPDHQYMKFNVDSLLRTDIKTRYDVYQVGRSIGILNRDEIRAMEDMTPLPGNQGKDYTPLELQYADVAHANRKPTSDPQPKGMPRDPGMDPKEAPKGPPEAVETPIRALYDLDGADYDGRDHSRLQFGKGSALWKYWTEGEGKAKWIGAVHKWTTLRRLLLAEHVPLREVDGLTTNIIDHVLPGYMATAHEKSG